MQPLRSSVDDEGRFVNKRIPTVGRFSITPLSKFQKVENGSPTNCIWPTSNLLELWNKHHRQTCWFGTFN